MNIADFLQVASENREIFPLLSRHLAKHQTLSRIIQNRQFLAAHLFHNPMGQSAEAQNVNIHNRVAGMFHHQVHLGLHGKLIRHDKQVIFIRMLQGLVYDMVMQFFALAGARSAEIKL